MNLETAIKEATKHLLKSDKARTYTVDFGYREKRSYVLALAKDEEDPTLLMVETWGFDEFIKIPQTRPELIALKCRAQMSEKDGVTQVALRYYLDILRRESNG